MTYITNGKNVDELKDADPTKCTRGKKHADQVNYTSYKPC